MTEFPTFKFILDDGTLTWELPQSPDGWEESFLEWQRSLNDYGVIRNYSIPLKWTLDGAFFLRNSFYKKGIQAFTEVTIKKLNTALMIYEDFYKGTIDYSSINDGLVTVEATIMDSGLAATINAYRNTTFEIQLEGDPDVKVIQMTGIPLQEKALLSIFSTITSSSNGKVPNISFDIQEQLTDITPLHDATMVEYSLGNEPYLNPADLHYFYLNTVDTQVTIKGELKGRMRSAIQDGLIRRVGFYFRFGAVETLLYTFEYTLTLGQDEYPFSFDVDFTAFVPNGQKGYLYCQTIPFNLATFIPIMLFDASVLTINYNVRYHNTNTLGLSAANVFDRLIEKMTGIPNKTRSGLLNTTFKDAYYTSGDALRQLAGATLKISLKNFIRDWLGIGCAGLGTEVQGGIEVAVLERRDYFFRDFRIDSLGLVQDCQFEVQENFIYSSIKVGSPDETTDDLNGRYEFNSEVQWKTPITRVSQEYDILTDSRTDAYGMEFTRINLEGKTTTDSKADNDAFILDTAIFDGVVRHSAVRLNRYTSASGSPAVEYVYNLFFSPKQNLLRHNYWLASSMWGQEAFFINWASALKNKELVTTDFSGVTVDEDEDIYIQTLGPKLFYPIVATVQAKYARNLVDLINKVPYGYLEFIWLDNTYYGYILEASFNPANYEDKEFKLLLTPKNNLLNLIR